ncbi:MAG: hypothetical protein K940chlam2_00657 [Chlamydiae bacterium]|nr:hypothetical protein [Chlamydiota bacterium]
MKLLIFLLFLSLGLQAGEFSDFDSSQGKCTKEQIERRLSLFLKKDSSLDQYLNLTDEALLIYDSPEGTEGRTLEYSLELAPKSVSAKTEKRKDLVGVKVAIDPGHFGGPYALLEERYIDIPPSLERKEAVRFNEGTLSLLTAQYVKLLLEKEGAIVSLTRDKVGEGVYPVDFFDWMRSYAKVWAGEGSIKGLFKEYNLLDLRARAEKINELIPDIAVIIHYNSHHVEAEYSSNSHMTSNNYNMVFMPGSFCRGELKEIAQRYEFVRLLVTDHLDESLALSRQLMGQFTEKLHIPAVQTADGARYLDRVCMKVEEGIYARNLALTRLVHCPLAYGETLVQNNIDECLNLSRTDFVIGGVRCSSRVKEVAEAYFEGIKGYLLGGEND